MTNRDWRVSAKNMDSVSFDAYIQDLRHVYQTADARRDVTDTALNLIKHASKVSEAVRRGQGGRILTELSHAVVWLLKLTAGLHGVNRDSDHPDRILYLSPKISEILWNKYPNHCPACLDREFQEEDGKFPDIRVGWSDAKLQDLGKRIAIKHDKEPEPCQCLSWSGSETRNEEAKSELKRRRKLARHAYAGAKWQEKKRRTSLRAIEKTFEGIFGVNVQKTSLPDIAFHLQEEVGELAEALAQAYTFDVSDPAEISTTMVQDRIDELADELADVFSWAYAMLFKMKEIIKASDEWWVNLMPLFERAINVEQISLASVIWSRYGSREQDHLKCATCGHDVCDEKVYVARTSENARPVPTVE